MGTTRPPRLRKRAATATRRDEMNLGTRSCFDWTEALTIGLWVAGRTQMWTTYCVESGLCRACWSWYIGAHTKSPGEESVVRSKDSCKSKFARTMHLWKHVDQSVLVRLRHNSLAYNGTYYVVDWKFDKFNVPESKQRLKAQSLYFRSTRDKM